jgi:hypothetical protein
MATSFLGSFLGAAAGVLGMGAGGAAAAAASDATPLPLAVATGGAPSGGGGSGGDGDFIIIRKGLLLKQGYVVKSWKERWFVLFRDRLAYYEPSDIVPDCTAAVLRNATPRGVVRLADIQSVTPLRGRGSFQLSVADALGGGVSAGGGGGRGSGSSGSGPSPMSPGRPGGNGTEGGGGGAGRDFYLVAATEGEKRAWIEALQRAMFTPTRVAEVLQATTDMAAAGRLCSREAECAKRWLLLGTDAGLERANDVLRRAAALTPAQRCSDAAESLLLDFELAGSEAELLAVLAALRAALSAEDATPSARDRLVELAMTHYSRHAGLALAAVPAANPGAGSGGGRGSASKRPSAGGPNGGSGVGGGEEPVIWSDRVQEAFGLVLHAIAVRVHRSAVERRRGRHAERERRRAARALRQGQGAAAQTATPAPAAGTPSRATSAPAAVTSTIVAGQSVEWHEDGDEEGLSGSSGGDSDVGSGDPELAGDSPAVTEGDAASSPDARPDDATPGGGAISIDDACAALREDSSFEADFELGECFLAGQNSATR